MTNSQYNSHIAISSPFGVGDLPTLFCWRNRIHKLNGEPEENLDTFMEEHLGRDDVRTFAAYRDDELGGYFSAMPGEMTFSDSSTAKIAKVEMVFKREFFKMRPEKENGAGVGGQRTTQPALNLVLRELFGEFELVFFPLAKVNRPIQSLVASVGAAGVGAVEGEGESTLFVLSRPEWERVNAGFIAEWEAATEEAVKVRLSMMEAMTEIFEEDAIAEQA